jgi:hypothetical protein
LEPRSFLPSGDRINFIHLGNQRGRLKRIKDWQSTTSRRKVIHP